MGGKTSQESLDALMQKKHEIIDTGEEDEVLLEISGDLYE